MFVIFTSIKPLLILGTVSQVGDVAHRLAYLDLHFDRFLHTMLFSLIFLISERITKSKFGIMEEAFL